MNRVIRVGFALSFALMACNTYAALVGGIFSGVVYGAFGSSAGFDLSQLNGRTIAGTFSYDPAALGSSLYVDDVTKQNSRYQYSPSVPVTISGTVSYPSSDFSFTRVGEQYSQVYVGQDFPGGHNWLELTGIQADAGDAVISLTNFFGLHYLSNIQDLGSLNFSESSPDSYGAVWFNAGNILPGGSGRIYFQIQSASAIGVTAPEGSVPEPTTLALVGVAVVGIAATRRRRLFAPMA